MEKYWAKFLCLFFLCNNLYAQEKSVYGKVTDPESNKGVANINILNKRSNQIVVTNDAGDFYMRAIPGDSILISSFGYNRAGIKWNGIEKNPVISAKLQPTMLQELVVTETKLTDLNREIKNFLANPRDPQSIRRSILRGIPNSNTSQPALGLSIDAIYMLFSKEGKSLQKLEVKKYEDIKSFYANLKYNKQTVAQITRLEEEDLDDFMNYCKLNQDFILNANDYELTFSILKCLGGFRKSRIIRSLR